MRTTPLLIVLLLLVGACGSEETSSTGTNDSMPTVPVEADPTPSSPDDGTIEDGDGDGRDDAGDNGDAGENGDGDDDVDGGDDGVDPALSAAVEFAVADLAERLGIDVGEIDVITATMVTWPDGSLGCPQPDMGYTQALVDGALIELGAGGDVYSYHANADGTPFLCEN